MSRSWGGFGRGRQRRRPLPGRKVSIRDLLRFALARHKAAYNIEARPLVQIVTEKLNILR
jgi:hypothetical protein